MTILLEPVLKTLLPSMTIAPIWTTHCPLRHAQLLAAGHLAQVAGDFVAAGVSDGAAAVDDAGIALLAVSEAVGAALGALGHAAGVAGELSGAALGGDDDGGKVLEGRCRGCSGEEAGGRFMWDEVCGGDGGW